MADLGDFLTAPRDFLKMNLLQMIGNGPASAGVYNFKFQNMTEEGLADCKRSSKFFFKDEYAINVWFVSESAKAGGDTLPIFWLPYKPNSLCRTILSKDAPLMLTASMTGCTFGKVKYRTGEVEVCHANYQTEEGGLDEARMGRETAWCPTRLAQTSYRERIRGKAVTDSARQAKMGATVVGVNDFKKGWKFYAQQWENLDGTHYIYHKLLDV